MRRIIIDKENVDIKKIAFGFPWKGSVPCYNFRSPNEVVLAEDISKLTGKEDIETVVIGCDLDDYSFLQDMVNLRQLYIYYGKNLNDISFVENLTNLTQICILESNIGNLIHLNNMLDKMYKIIEADPRKKLVMGMEAICINSTNKNLDGSKLLDHGHYISEVIINDKALVKLG